MVDFLSIDMNPFNLPAATGTNSGSENPGGAACESVPASGDGIGNGLDDDGDTVIDDGCPNAVPYVPVKHTLGPLDSCISKVTGATFDVDITVDEVDPSDLIEGWQVTLIYDPTKLNVIAPPAIIDSTFLTLLGEGAAPVSFTANPNADGPDDDGPAGPGGELFEGVDGTLVFSAADLSADTHSGHGILARFRFKSVGPGISAVKISGDPLYVNPSNGFVQPVPAAQLKKPVNTNLPIVLVRNAVEAQDTPCPNPADLAKLGIDMSALPASVPVSSTVVFPISESIIDYGNLTGPDNASETTSVVNTLAPVEDPVPGPGGPCDDGIDNGGDLLTDLADPDCQVKVSFHVTAGDLAPPVSLTKVEVDTDGNGTFDLTAPPPPLLVGDIFVGYKIRTTKTVVLPVAVEDPVPGPGGPCNDGLNNGGGDAIDLADPDCAPFVLTQTYDVHCLIPSTHAIKKTNTIANLDPFVTDPVSGNNAATATKVFTCTAVSDLNITSQTISPATASFITDNGVDDDGDTTVDEDPIELGIAPINNDAQDGANEDGGMVVPIGFSKSIKNNGPYGPTATTDILKVYQGNANAGLCGISFSPLGPFVAGFGGLLTIPMGQQSIASGGTNVYSTPVGTIWLRCGRNGYGVDDDGDAINRIAPAAVDLIKDAFIDEDPPGDANLDGAPGFLGIDDDGDLLADALDLQVIAGVAGAATTGYVAANDDDEDGKADEDGPLALPAIVADDCADSKDIHISDPAPEPDLLTAPAFVLHDTCELTKLVMQGVLPFTPSGAITIDEVDANLFIAPVGNDCLVTTPCKMQAYYAYGGCATVACVTAAHHDAGTAHDQGGEALAGYSLVEGAIPASTPGAFQITNGNGIVDGDTTMLISASLTLRVIAGTPCATAGTLPFLLKDGDLLDKLPPPWPAALPAIDTTPLDDTVNVAGTGADDLALFSPLTWPTHLNALVAAIDGSAPPAFDGYPALWQRNVGSADVDGPGGLDPIPINELVFNLDLDSVDRNTATGVDLSGDGNTDNDGPWLRTSTIGNPDLDADLQFSDGVDFNDNGFGGNVSADPLDPDRDSDGIENSLELAQCTPLSVTLISLGLTVGGTVYRVCTKINPINPPGSLGHTDVQTLQRADIGTKYPLPSQVGCAGESDIKASIIKDEAPGDGIPGPNPPGGIDNDADTSIDEDPTVNGISEDLLPNPDLDGEDPVGDIVKAGEPQGIPVRFDVENGAVPGNVNVKLTIVGPVVCNPTWVGQAGDTVSNSILGPLKYSIIDRVELGMLANEIRYLDRKYIVTCPPGSNGPFNIFNNVSTASGLPDPNINNNQAENNFQILATPDVDHDTVPNQNDNCNWTANPGQLDTDGDGVGDACDTDDDNDDVPDSGDECPLIPEDPDGVDDEDGCPDTDVTVDVVKDEDYDVDVSTDVFKTVTITVTNGNYPAFVNMHILAVSLLGKCEVRLIPNIPAGDVYSEFSTDESPPAGDDTLNSQIERTDFYNAFEVKVFVRQYKIHCFQRSAHSFELQVDAIPLPPVKEEKLKDNVHKNFPTVRAWDKADVKKVSWVFSAPPATVKVGQAFSLTLLGTLHNNGPTSPITFSDTATISLPLDCTPNPIGPFPWGGPSTLVTSVPFPLSPLVIGPITCTEQSDHTFTSTNCVTVTSLHVRDPGPNNLPPPNNVPDCKTAQVIVKVIADADVKVVSVTVTADDPVGTGVNFNVKADEVLHNNGPEDPVNVDVTFPALAGPGDCVIAPAGAQVVQNVSLAVSALVTVTANWTVHCANPSFHKFTASNSVVVDQLHVVDPDGSNNSGSGDDTNSVLHKMEKKICDFYIGKAPVPGPVYVGPAQACPAVKPWNGGPAAIAVVPSTNNTLVSDDLDYSSEPVNIKKSTILEVAPAALAGPQNCDVGDFIDEPKPSGDSAGGPFVINGLNDAIQIYQEAEPAGLSRQPVPEQWDIHLPLPLHDGLPNWCVLGYRVVKEIKDLHVSDNITGDLDVLRYFDVYADTDGDGVPDNYKGTLDNCKLVPNPGQEDSNHNTVGDACDKFNDVTEKFIDVLGPAAVNVSDTNGRYMWVIGEMGNLADKSDVVKITLTITPTLPPPTGCEQDVDLILPGQDTFLMLPHEQKFQVYRVRYECHSPALSQVISLTIKKCIQIEVGGPFGSHDDDLDGLVDEDSRDGIDQDGDSEDGEDPPNPDDNPNNDCKQTTKQLIIDPPSP